jgi:hypothetical protein
VYTATANIFPDLDHASPTRLLDPNSHLLVVTAKAMSTDATSPGKSTSKYVPLIASYRIHSTSDHRRGNTAKPTSTKAVDKGKGKGKVEGVEDDDEEGEGGDDDEDEEMEEDDDDEVSRVWVPKLPPSKSFYRTRMRTTKSTPRPS